MNTRRSFLGCLAALPLLALRPFRRRSSENVADVYDWVSVPGHPGSVQFVRHRPRRIRSVCNGRWDDPTTWDRNVPQEGDRVYVSHKIDGRGIDPPPRLTITMDSVESELRFE
jgi:hypothetical protein